jgi:hypothetical protein
MASLLGVTLRCNCFRAEEIDSVISAPKGNRNRFYLSRLGGKSQD